MSDDDRDERWKAAMRHGTRPEPDRSDCPNADTLALLVAQPDAAPAGTLSHVERCSACAREVASLARVPELETMARQMVPQRRLTRWVSVATAACLVLAIGLGSYLIHDTSPESTLRTAPGDAGIVPADGAVLQAPPEALNWPASDDRRYRLVVYDSEARRLWTSEPVGSGRIELPEAVRESLSPGLYYWQLRIVETGTVEGPYAFEVAPGDGD